MFGLEYFLGKKQKSDTSRIAKERLQLMIAYERDPNMEKAPDFMDDLREELLAVIGKYVKVDEKDVEIQMDREGSRSVLGISISAPIKK